MLPKPRKINVEKYIGGLSKIENEMNKINDKLKSENFIQNAPKEIIDEQNNRHKEYVLSKEKIEMAIKSLG